MDSVEALRAAVEQAGTIVRGVTSEQSGLPTPCPEWNVRALLNHTVGSLLMFGPDDAAPHDRLAASLGRRISG